MTQQDFERTYRGDATHNWDRSRVVIFTCPVCGAQGFSRERLVTHVMEEHPSPGSSTSSQVKREEMACPICISTYSYRTGFPESTPNHLTDMAAHMLEYHVHTSPSTPSAGGGSSQNAQSVTAGFTEYLRDDDLRRVILNNIPLMSDMEFDESFSETTRRHISALLTSSRNPLSAVCHSRRRSERSSERSGHEEENSSQANAQSLRSVSYTSRNLAFGRHWPVTSNRQNSTSFFSSLPIRLRPLRQNDGESTRSVNSTAQANVAFRSFLHRDSNTAGSTSAISSTRITQPSGVLIRPVRRVQQHNGSSSDRALTDGTSRSQQYGRSIGRLNDFDRSTTSSTNRYSRELIRSFYESARRAETSSLIRSRRVKGPSTSNIENNEKVEQTPISSTSSKKERDSKSRTDKQAQPLVSGNFLNVNRLSGGVGNFCRKNDPNDEEVEVKEPVFVENAGKATLLLPHPARLKSDIKDGNDRLECDKRHEENQLKNSEDEKSTSNGKNIKKKKQKQRREQQQPQLGRDDRLNWLHSYQPLFISLAELAAPLPTIHINTSNSNDEDGNCLKVWDKPKKIPEILIAHNEAETIDEGSSNEHGQVSLPTLVLNVGRSFKCSYDPSAIAGKEKDLTVSKLENSDSDTVAIRKTLEAIKKMEEKKRAEAAARTTSSKKSVEVSRSNNETQVHCKQSFPTKIQQNSKESKVDEPLRMDAADRFQNAFKEATKEVILGSFVGQSQLPFKPYHVVPEKTSSELIKEWLGKERSEEGNYLGLGLHLDDVIKGYLTEIPDFIDDDLIEDDDLSVSDGDPMFDSSEGTDNELLSKKCVSCGIVQGSQLHYAAGPLNAALNEKESFENDYWKNYRFLHNRRDALLLRKCVESPPENTLDSSDWRFVRQLLLGVRDVPASRFLRCHFFDNTYSAVLECNLRSLVHRQAQIFSHDLSEEELTDDSSSKISSKKFAVSFDDNVSRIISDTKFISVHPVLWNFLNLSGFIAE